MDTPTARSTSMPGTAAYLRCYPYDVWQMDFHRQGLCTWAARLGLPEPTVFLDNGCMSHDPLPLLQRLVVAVTTGIYQVVLVPGNFVFSLHDDAAQQIARRITAHGCRLLELPRHGEGWSDGAPDRAGEPMYAAARLSTE
ncbi:hypothetical protein [Kitasatospora sp. NPDC057015]|uniref:hypothetical protein n=1 Tax=Kitasatospora sp. NPDC057015 TaxID=3346001 RepID=UPI00362A9A13